MNINHDSQLEQQLQNQTKMKKKARFSEFVIKYGVVIMIVAVFLPFVLPPLLGVVFFIAGYFGAIPFIIYVLIRKYKHGKADRDVRQTVVAEIIPSILNEFFENVTYNPNETIPHEQIRETGIWSNEEMEKIKGNDYIQGKYKGIPLQICDAEIYWVEREPNVRDRERDIYVTHTVFKGQWVILETTLSPHSPVNVLENNNGAYRRIHRKKMENITFNERFQVKGDPLDVFQIITPMMEESLMSIDEGGTTMLRFLPDGRVGLALATNMNILEVDNQAFGNVGEVRSKIREDLKRILRVVDALNLG